MVTLNPPQKLDSRSWLVSWSSDLGDPTFYVYQDGLSINETKQTEQVFTVDAGESLIIEVLDDPDAVPITAFPGRLTLNWRTSAATDYYRIEEYIEAAWILRAKVKDSGGGYFKWKTRFLEDSATHQFRIIPVGTNGNQGTAKVFSCLMVRHPDLPNVGYEYSDDTHKVTVTTA